MFRIISFVLTANFLAFFSQFAWGMSAEQIKSEMDLFIETTRLEKAGGLILIHSYIEDMDKGLIFSSADNYMNNALKAERLHNEFVSKALSTTIPGQSTALDFTKKVIGVVTSENGKLGLGTHIKLFGAYYDIFNQNNIKEDQQNTAKEFISKSSDFENSLQTGINRAIDIYYDRNTDTDVKDDIREMFKSRLGIDLKNPKNLEAKLSGLNETYGHIKLKTEMSKNDLATYEKAKKYTDDKQQSFEAKIKTGNEVIKKQISKVQSTVTEIKIDQEKIQSEIKKQKDGQNKLLAEIQENRELSQVQKDEIIAAIKENGRKTQEEISGVKDFLLEEKRLREQAELQAFKSQAQAWENKEISNFAFNIIAQNNPREAKVLKAGYDLYQGVASVVEFYSKASASGVDISSLALTAATGNYVMAFVQIIGSMNKKDAEMAMNQKILEEIKKIQKMLEALKIAITENFAYQSQKIEENTTLMLEAFEEIESSLYDLSLSVGGIRSKIAQIQSEIDNSFKQQGRFSREVLSEFEKQQDVECNPKYFKEEYNKVSVSKCIEIYEKDLSTLSQSELKNEMLTETKNNFDMNVLSESIYEISKGSIPNLVMFYKYSARILELSDVILLNERNLDSDVITTLENTKAKLDEMNKTLASYHLNNPDARSNILELISQFESEEKVLNLKIKNLVEGYIRKSNFNFTPSEVSEKIKEIEELDGLTRSQHKFSLTGYINSSGERVNHSNVSVSACEVNAGGNVMIPTEYLPYPPKSVSLLDQLIPNGSSYFEYCYRRSNKIDARMAYTNTHGDRTNFHNFRRPIYSIELRSIKKINGTTIAGRHQLLAKSIVMGIDTIETGFHHYHYGWQLSIGAMLYSLKQHCSGKDCTYSGGFTNPTSGDCYSKNITYNAQTKSNERVKDYSIGYIKDKSLRDLFEYYRNKRIGNCRFGVTQNRGTESLYSYVNNHLDYRSDSAMQSMGKMVENHEWSITPEHTFYADFDRKLSSKNNIWHENIENFEVGIEFYKRFSERNIDYLYNLIFTDSSLINGIDYHEAKEIQQKLLSESEYSDIMDIIRNLKTVKQKIATLLYFGTNGLAVKDIRMLAIFSENGLSSLTDIDGLINNANNANLSVYINGSSQRIENLKALVNQYSMQDYAHFDKMLNIEYKKLFRKSILATQSEDENDQGLLDQVFDYFLK